ncbi:uncharacterized protein LOC125370640 [Ricinus communis]|uniref:uncharacterized protein LOC125370640 n=1 Tax=Ricinus communis TaxID=3988 RepID=UPI00201A90FB|nr:uncharacterized protein LOC125370640 [Ricinus communis]
MVVQCGSKDVEHVVYYLNKKLLPYELKYNLMEETCLAMIWAIRKLRHYFQSYKVHAILKIDPLKKLFEAPSLTEKLARWLVLLTKFDIEYITKKVVKGVIEIQEWKMYFDGVVNAIGAGLGVVLITLEGEMLPIDKRLDFKVTNNMVEYEAYLFGLEAAVVAGAKHLIVYRDSMLMADALATLSSVWVNPLQLSMKPLVIVKLGAPYYQGDRIMQVHMEPKKNPWSMI